MGLLQWRWPWAMLAAVVALAVVLVAVRAVCARRERRERERSGHADGVATVWSLDDDLGGEAASRLMRRWRLWSRVGAGLLGLALAVAIVLAGRPATVDANAERGESRDIVLCLDVSGSALPYDREVIASYLSLVDRFQGERIGLSIFNSTSRTVFPLTDDYDLVKSQLSEANDLLKGVQTQDDINNMSDQDYQKVSDWLAGTQNRKQSTSLIGDGLVSCAAMLPGFSATGDASAAQAAGRSASIVLATDNVVSGSPTYTLAEALDLTHEVGITVDGLFSGPQQSESDQATQEMKTLIESHGGVFLTQRNGDSVNALVREIESRRAAEADQPERSSLVDAPGWFSLALAVLFLCYLTVVWRLKR
ncbi:VWA domain-containing protein [Bifidobacterium avesanii]|uniref:VWA domain-containing protein n=1 Tax=Bifidobacterium avesanii TaxID=1798157 RepID=A0A7K3TG26_9BIFI|nr:VWA domain-containing protein [Bifidobacterium avesanii]KAB8295620.1 VWA domain-containing protein [Bifidobacterium avesanii]NEG77624.1 VWA domain-containing protein [Bifidobacterium avesanii]